MSTEIDSYPEDVYLAEFYPQDSDIPESYPDEESDQETLIEDSEEDEPVFIPLDILLAAISKEFDDAMCLIYDAKKTSEEMSDALRALQAISSRITDQQELYVQFPDFTSSKQYDVWEIQKDIAEVRHAMES
ncbi:hypothetical protein BDQ17DRAFT_1336029 [Cyathus striatus]|nr:hypothetical protein BDQ17DRAFT_1336029 [Cyathus striatus]